MNSNHTKVKSANYRSRYIIEVILSKIKWHIKDVAKHISTPHLYYNMLQLN